MENFDDFENKSYEKARVINYSAVLIPEIAENIIKLFSPSKPKNISGQLSLVTGGANGLGKEIAMRLAREGCNVAVVDINFPEAQRTAKEIEDCFKVASKAFKADVSNFASIEQLKIDVEREMGKIDILVNNAGILSALSLREGRPEDIQKVIDVNLTSHFWTNRVFLDGMIERKRGHIIAISSLGGKVSFPLAVAYVSTKFGVDGFMSALFDELCLYNHEKFIKTTTVFPGFINTRKELGNILDEVGEIAPRMSSEYVADVIVKGILVNKKSLVIPTSAHLARISQFLPSKTMKFVKTLTSPVQKLRTL